MDLDSEDIKNKNISTEIQNNDINEDLIEKNEVRVWRGSYECFPSIILHIFIFLRKEVKIEWYYKHSCLLHSFISIVFYNEFFKRRYSVIYIIFSYTTGLFIFSLGKRYFGQKNIKYVFLFYVSFNLFYCITSYMLLRRYIKAEGILMRISVFIEKRYNVLLRTIYFLYVLLLLIPILIVFHCNNLRFRIVEKLRVSMFVVSITFLLVLYPKTLFNKVILIMLILKNLHLMLCIYFLDNSYDDGLCISNNLLICYTGIVYQTSSYIFEKYFVSDKVVV
ncbi:hypothetical protein CWI38_0326p0050 [Hamiltosporidium tvaerminnensis]|uniref:Uncharacterized protein n=1 Tax=Hamiltosporidium tvaerminnensis TaxID=1176355 RepID=A0A4V2JY10_9MICR|nr:hypothetical protein CWI38_0326p0050 [Hamiltosporidium tvaerminnensis]